MVLAQDLPTPDHRAEADGRPVVEGVGGVGGGSKVYIVQPAFPSSAFTPEPGTVGLLPTARGCWGQKQANRTNGYGPRSRG